MTSKHLVKAITILIFVTVTLTPLFYLKYGVYPYTLGKTPFFQGVVEIAFFLWIALIFLEKKYRPARTPVFWSITAFCGALIITAIFGVDPFRSFWSIQERAFGVVTFLHLGIFALIISSLFRELPWKKLLYASLGTGVATGITAFLQIVIPNLLLVEPIGGRPGATFGNPTFLAGYLLMNIGIGVYLLCDLWREDARPDSRVLQKKIFIFASVCILGAAVFRTQTRGDILGLLAMLLALILVFAVRPPALRIRFLRNRRLCVSLLAGALLFGALFWTTRSSPTWEHIPGLNRFRDISLEAQSLQPRLIGLKDAWIGFAERPLTGWGWDNFNIVYNKQYDPHLLELNYEETRSDKPHNIFAEYLVDGGLLLSLAYAALIGFFIFELSRGKDKTWSQVMYALLVGYAVRSMFIFETIGPALLLFVLFGITDGRYREESGMYGNDAEAAHGSVRPHESGAQKPAATLSPWLAGSALIAGLAAAYALNVQTLRASNYQYEGFIAATHRRPWLAIQNFELGTGLWTPYRWNFKIDYAASIAEAYFYNPGLLNPNDVLHTIRGMEEVAAEHPQDAYNHYALVDMYNQISDIDLKGLTAKAEREAAIALELSPNRQEIYFSLAKTKTIEGDLPAALAITQKAIALDPKVPDGHFYYGIIAFAAKDPVRGYAEVKEAVALGRQWKNANEPRVVANYFADNGHLPEAIDLYKAALGLDPNDMEAKIKLGVGYFFLGNRDMAKQYLAEVAQTVDLSKSPAYASLVPIFKELNIPLSAPQQK